jgi:hypothetical protein
MLSFHQIEESLVDVSMKIWFYITTLYVQVEHGFYVLNFYFKFLCTNELHFVGTHISAICNYVSA